MAPVVQKAAVLLLPEHLPNKSEVLSIYIRPESARHGGLGEQMLRFVCQRVFILSLNLAGLVAGAVGLDVVFLRARRSASAHRRTFSCYETGDHYCRKLLKIFHRRMNINSQAQWVFVLHGVQELAPRVEQVSLGQGSQEEEPGVRLKVPGLHGKHSDVYATPEEIQKEGCELVSMTRNDFQIW